MGISSNVYGSLHVWGSNKVIKCSEYSKTAAESCYHCSCCHEWYVRSQCPPMEGPVESSFDEKDVAISVEVAIKRDIRPTGPCIDFLTAAAFAGLNLFQALSAAFG